MALSNAERVKLHRLRQLGLDGKPCPENTSREECLAWAQGVWKRQGDQMDAISGTTPRPKVGK